MESHAMGETRGVRRWAALLVLVLAVLWIEIFRKLYENKTEIPGLLDDDDLSEQEMGIQFSEQPTFDVY